MQHMQKCRIGKTCIALGKRSIVTQWRDGLHGVVKVRLGLRRQLRRMMMQTVCLHGYVSGLETLGRLFIFFNVVFFSRLDFWMRVFLSDTRRHVMGSRHVWHVDLGLPHICCIIWLCRFLPVHMHFAHFNSRRYVVAVDSSSSFVEKRSISGEVAGLRW